MRVLIVFSLAVAMLAIVSVGYLSARLDVAGMRVETLADRVAELERRADGHDRRASDLAAAACHASTDRDAIYDRWQQFRRRFGYVLSRTPAFAQKMPKPAPDIQRPEAPAGRYLCP